MSTVLDFGDPKAALLDFWATHPILTLGVAALGIAGIDPLRIGGHRAADAGLALPGDYITATGAGGPGARHQTEARRRFDCWFYGADHLRALDLARLAFLALNPAPPAIVGFDRAGSNVVDVILESAPSERLDPIGKWPVVIQTVVLVVRAREIAVVSP